ncbi:MAG: zf-HC2 domain-containing protein [bacterium]|nr:zf-HC2 domain-containing protein [bacterium]
MNHYKPIEISKFIDDELDEENYAAVKEHLLGCKDCRDIYESYSFIKNEMKFIEKDVPETLCSRILTKTMNFKTAKQSLIFKLSFGLAMLLLFAFSFSMSMNKGKAVYENSSAKADESIADEFISGLSSAPSGSLSRMVSYTGR